MQRAGKQSKSRNRRKEAITSPICAATSIIEQKEVVSPLVKIIASDSLASPLIAPDEILLCSSLLFAIQTRERDVLSFEIREERHVIRVDVRL